MSSDNESLNCSQLSQSILEIESSEIESLVTHYWAASYGHLIPSSELYRCNYNELMDDYEDRIKKVDGNNVTYNKLSFQIN